MTNKCGDCIHFGGVYKMGCDTDEDTPACPDFESKGGFFETVRRLK